MYKGRLGIWIPTIIICFIISFLTAKIPVWFHTDNITFSASVKNDVDISEELAGEKVNGLKFSQRNEGADILIKTADDTKVDGYKKISNALVSPVVMYMNNDIRNGGDYEKGLVEIDNNTYRIDLYSVLTAIEGDKEWSSLGIYKKIAKGKIKLTIPNEHSGYYNEVVDLFYFALNDYETPTQEERDALKTRVNKILGKCEKVIDINQAVADEAKDCKYERVFIGPEYLFVRGNGGFSGNNSDGFMPIYFVKHTYLYADVYIKNTDNNENNVGKMFEDKFLNKTGFMETVGWRVQNANFDVTDVKSELLRNP